MGLRFGLQIPVVLVARRRARTARTRCARSRAAAEDAGFVEHLGDGPLPPDPDVRPGVARHARELHDARVSRRRDRAGAAGHARHRRDVPQRRATSGRSSRRSTSLSGGRAMCGLGLGWFAPSTTRTDGRSRPSTRATRCSRTRSGAAAALGQGRARVRGPSAAACPKPLCYPRPLQEHVPVLVGGNGERRTLRLAAQYADACNVIGEVEVVARKVAVLHAHCDDVGPRPRRGRGHATLDDARRPRPGRGRRARRTAAAPSRRAPSGTRRASTPAPSPIRSAGSARSPTPACRPRSSASPTSPAPTPSSASPPSSPRSAEARPGGPSDGRIASCRDRPRYGESRATECIAE